MDYFIKMLLTAPDMRDIIAENSAPDESLQIREGRKISCLAMLLSVNQN